MIRPIFKCHGGKWYLHNWIISHFPDNYEKLHYIEVYGGGASVLLNKKQSAFNALNDLDSNIYDIYNYMKHKSQEFMLILNKLTYSSATFLDAKYTHTKIDSIENAIRELILRRFSRGGFKKQFSNTNRLRGGREGNLNAWETWLDTEFHNIVSVLEKATLYKINGFDLIYKFDSPHTLFYIDPPYLQSTRVIPKAYDLEMTYKDHLDLVYLLKKIKGKFILSGYYNEMYATHLVHCNMYTKRMVNRACQLKVLSTKIECLWTNY